jgi:hypothetical protein
VNVPSEAIPDGDDTNTFPVPPFATVAVICVDEFTVNELAAVPPNDTAVAPVKLVPVIVTIVPINPDVGLKEVMVVDGSFILFRNTLTNPDEL